MNILIGWNTKFVGDNGGMEKVFCNFANAMVRRGHQVTMVYCTEKSGKSCTPLNSKIQLINIADYLPKKKWESAKPILFIIKREILRCINKRKMKQKVVQFDIDYLSKAVRKILSTVNPDIIISLDARTSALFGACKSVNSSLITMSHFNAEHILSDTSKLEEQALIDSDRVQVLMPHDIQVFEKSLPGIKLVHIPNVVPQYNVKEIEERENLIVNVARIDAKQKRQHLLLEAFARIATKYPDWKMEFWGEEQGRRKYTKYLMKIVKKNHLENRVFLKGNTNDVLSVYQRARIFALPSAFEGFPLAMTEAMSAGLPIIAYKSCPAVNEIVDNGKNGILVNNGIDAYANGLEKMISDLKLCGNMGKAAKESMKQYSEDVVWGSWEDLLQRTISEKKILQESANRLISI